MSANRRFFAVENENNIFTFTIDTRNVIVGATNGSQLDNQYILPLSSDSGHNENRFIIRVHDGRPDISVTGRLETDSKKVIPFTTPGMYKISIIGTITGRYSTQDKPDVSKLIEVNQWSQTIGFSNAFYYASNVLIKATNPILLKGVASRNMFIGTRGFDSKEAVSALITSSITDATSMFGVLSLELKDMPNVFWNEIEVFSQTFFGTKIANSVDKIEFVAPKLKIISAMFWNPGWSVNTNLRLIIKAPNLYSIDRLWYGASPFISFGEVDIRSLTYCNQLFRSGYPQAKMDETLLGWVNNFDWSGVAPVTNKVTIDCYNTKYSNNPAVIVAKAFLESKGYVFTNLTMA